MKNSARTLADVRAVLEQEQRPLGPNSRLMADAIRARHPGAVDALLYYGSSLREGAGSARMLDFYVLVKDYRSVYGTGLKRWLAFLAPPGVHFVEIETPDGEKLSTKYSVISTAAFHRRARGAALESMLWARFTQPCVIDCDDEKQRARLLGTLAHAAAHFAGEIAPLFRGPATAQAFWAAGLEASYRTELRAENPALRAQEIIAGDAGHYTALSRALFDFDDENRIIVKSAGLLRRNACRWRWITRRVLGKPAGAFRVVKAALTFDNGLDYLLNKIERHSGVSIEISERARRHPVLFAPVLGWRLFKRGAFH